MLISEVVEAKHSYRWVDPVISQNATVREAIVSTIEGGLSGMMVLGEGNHVVGLLTSRDLLRIIASGIVEEESNDQVLQKVVKDEGILTNSIVNDLYFLGRTLGNKYHRLRITYFIFMLGMVMTVITFALTFIFAG